MRVKRLVRPNGVRHTPQPSTRLRTTVRLADNQRRSQDQVQIAGVVVADATREGCPLTYVSPGFEQLTGYAAADILGRQCSVLQGPDTDPRAVEVLRHAIATGTDAYVTIRNYRADGTPFWNEVALVPPRDADGRVVQYLGVQRDVTARRLDEARIVQDRPSTDQAAIVSAVAAERERTGASILAEGIENDSHLAVARTLGATLGQGWLWGRPGPLPSRTGRPWTRRQVARREPAGRTPFEVIAAERPTASATKSLVLPMSHHMENRALRIGEGAVVLAAFQDAKHFTPHTVRRYEMLARGASLVAALGVELGEDPVPGVRGAHIEPDDPLAGEWSVIVIGPHFAGALVAQDLGDTGRERDRRFIFATAYDRGLVIAAARTLLARIAPVGLPPGLLAR